MLGRKEEAVTVLENGVEFIMAQAKDYNKKTDLHIPIFPDVRFSYGFDGNAEYKESGERAKNLFQTRSSPRCTTSTHTERWWKR